MQLFADKYASKDNIIQVAKQLGLTTFVELLHRTYLHWTLRASRPITVFIPSNEALKNFFTTAAGVEVLKDNQQLRVFILMHVVGGKWPTHSMRNRKRLECILPGKWRELNLQFYKRVCLFCLSSRIILRLLFVYFATIMQHPFHRVF